MSRATPQAALSEFLPYSELSGANNPTEINRLSPTPQGLSDTAGCNIANLKKQAMVEAATQLLAEKDLLPVVLRRHVPKSAEKFGREHTAPPAF